MDKNVVRKSKYTVDKKSLDKNRQFRTEKYLILVI